MKNDRCKKKQEVTFVRQQISNGPAKTRSMCVKFLAFFRRNNLGLRFSYTYPLLCVVYKSNSVINLSSIIVSSTDQPS